MLFLQAKEDAEAAKKAKEEAAKAGVPSPPVVRTPSVKTKQ